LITLLYGQPGTGKTTLATSILIDYASQGRKVAANYHVDLAPASNNRKGLIAQQWVTVLPDRPTFEQLKSVGFGWQAKDQGREDRAGLLVIDEAGPWLNSRQWNDKERPEIIDWLLHSRKRGWDIVFIAQAPTLLDKQVREAVIEGYARCRRTDRMKFPMTKISLPRFHVAICRYGLGPNEPVLERWVYRGGDAHKCFDSHALFDEGSGPGGPYSTLPPAITKWRDYMTPLARWLESRKPVAPEPKPKHRLAHLISQLPPDQRVKHWQRFAQLGAL
jgi:hypothetical protein